MEKKDPLAVLVSSDAKSTDRQKLAELLAPYMVIDQDTKGFGFTSSFDDLQGNKTKVEVLLAGAKARSLLFGDPDGMLPAEVLATRIMAEGSMKSSLKRLFDGRKIKKDKDGRYSFPAHRVPELTKRLTSK